VSFLFPSLLWIGLPLLAGPILLHLLNLRRQRRVEWAAMQYLLESQERNKNWVNLRQWLLLAARLAIVLLVVLMLARPSIQGNLAAWLSADRVHHLIVLDDSYSMADNGGATPVWENARSAVNHLLQVANENPQHQVSVLRTSQLPPGIAPSDPPQPLAAQGREEIASLIERLQDWKPSHTAADLEPAIAAAGRYLEQLDDAGSTVAYIVSDFRARNLEPTDRFTDTLAALGEQSDAVHFVPCSAAQQSNLSISRLTLAAGSQSAGLELTGEVTVVNHSRRPVENVTVQLTRDGQQLPAVELGAIAARDQATRKFPVRFPQPGDHTIQAQLDADALAPDNRRLFAATLPEDRPLLIVDGSPGGHEGRAFATALRPGGQRALVKTGWRPKVVAASKMDMRLPLDEYAAVLLLDVPRISPALAVALQQFVSQGGGVLLGMGPSVDRLAYNRLLLGTHDGALLPVQLDLPTQATASNARPDGDLVVTDHPLLRVFAGDRNSFLKLIAVNYYFGLEQDPKRPLPPELNVIASLPSGAPLMVEHTPGKGRVIGLFTAVARPATAVEGWSNLSTSPVFPVLVNELAAYLAAPRLEQPQIVVGQSWDQLALATTGGDGLQFRPATDSAPASTPAADSRGPLTPGLYRTTGLAPAAEQLIAVNVASDEGDLLAPNVTELRDRFAEQQVAITTLAEFRNTLGDTQQASMYRLLGGAALLILLIEQLLAYVCSYHEPHGKPARGNA